MLALSLFASNFIFIFLKAFQQKNVAFDKYWAVVPTSLLMGVAEVYMIASIAVVGFDWKLILAIGLGGGLGAITSMYLHNRIFNEQTRVGERT